MGFWFFMLLMDLLIPFVMIGFGKYFSKTAPKEINVIFGYRTTASMKNEDTWVFAHKYCGKIWCICGLVMLPLSVIIMVLTIGKTKDIIGTVGSVICFIQMIPLIGSIFLTEKALKKTFDENGNRR